jgi:hypothetical protein
LVDSAQDCICSFREAIRDTMCYGDEVGIIIDEVADSTVEIQLGDVMIVALV